MKVSFLSVFAFDANVSLIHALKKKCDVTFYTEALHVIYNYIDRNKLDQLFTKGEDVEQIKRFKTLIPLQETTVIKGVKMSSIFKKLYNSFKIDQLLKKENPDIIVIDNVTITYIVSAFRLRKKALLIVHDPFQHSGEEFFVQKWLRKLFFSLIKNKIVLNNNQKERFIKENSLNEKFVHSSFLSVYEYLTFYNDEVIEKKNEDFNILFFGRISPYKGIEFLLETYVELLTSNPNLNINITIAGSGNFYFDINSYKKYRNINIINKFISPEELSKLVFESSIVVCPYTDATQSGVVMSAFAFKKPVIATNVGGLPEMVEHDKTGYIIEKNNKEELKEAILSLYNDRSILEKMSENIYKDYFEGDKSWNKSAELFFRAFQEMQKQQ